MRLFSRHTPIRPASSGKAGFLRRLAGRTLLCRGCLGPLGAEPEAGLCGVCWSGLISLSEARCPCCALVHAESLCPDPVAWIRGDAFWDYHGGRPPFGALILPGIKAGELGWRKALLGRAARAPLPAFASEVDLVTAVPTAAHRRWLRGFDLAEDAARQVAGRIARPFLRTLAKGLRRQAVLSASARRELPRRAVRLHHAAAVAGKVVLLVDDAWTTGTTLLRCAQALAAGGAAEVRVLTLFRAT
jgi:predicted amidophosphoribosyltransferase